MTEDNDAVTAAQIFLRQKRATEKRLDIENPKELIGNTFGAELFRLVALGQINRARSICGKAVEGSRLSAPVEKSAAEALPNCSSPPFT